MIRRQQVVQALGRFRRRSAFQQGRRRRQLADLLADQIQTFRIVLGRIMRDAAGTRVQTCAAQRFRVGDLADGAFHQIRAAEPHEAGALHHNDDVGQRGQVRAAGDAHAHHGGDLRDVQAAAHQRVVIKNPRRAVLAGKNSVLIGQIHARGIHQINDRDAIAHGDFLGSQNF